MIKTQTLKGFRDFLPGDARKRQYVINKLKQVFESYGFEPLETPALEFASTLKGKYGEEEKLIYEFKTKGGDEVALRYDQTVPLARVITQYPNLSKPFKRYQIQPVWRGENPQKGRFREFLQCDIDTVGSSSPLADAEVIACVLEVMKNLGFSNSYMEINDRIVFTDLEPKYISAIDKLKKIGAEGVVQELKDKGSTESEAKKLLDQVSSTQPSESLKQIFAYLEKLGFQQDKDFKYVPTLARGLNYYTGAIFELISPDYGEERSLGGGGRYDKLIGLYSGQDNPATGFAFGFDRLVEAMTELNLLPSSTSSTQVLVTIFSPALQNNSLEVCFQLRSNKINTEIYLDPDVKLEKQLKYADQKGIPYVVIIGPEEKAKDKLVLKDLKNRTQETLSLDELISKLTS